MSARIVESGTIGGRRSPPAIRAADGLAQAMFDGLLGCCGDVRYWRPGDPADAEARQDWTRLVAYADTRDDFIAAQREGER